MPNVDPPSDQASLDQYSDEAMLAWTVQDVLDAMPDKGEIWSLSNWPAGACDAAAYIIACLFAEHHFVGWTVVTACGLIEICGHKQTMCHTWLVHEADEGVVDYSINITAHQFEYAIGPWVQTGKSPSAAAFPDVQSRIAVDPDYEQNAQPIDPEIEALRRVRELIAS